MDNQLYYKGGKAGEKTATKCLCSVNLLVEEMKLIGPKPSPDWPNYGQLNVGKNMDKRHCHLKKGRPTYVCCWEVVNKQIQIIEVYYVGTHEKAPY